MAEIRGFRASRFTVEAGPLSRLIAPPSDEVTPEGREGLATEPNNIVHATMPPFDPDDRSKFVRYARASAQLAGWRRGGLMTTDARAMQYVLSADVEGRHVSAVFALVPHAALPAVEVPIRTRDERLRMLEATRMQLEPVVVRMEDSASFDGSSGQELARAVWNGGEMVLSEWDGPGTFESGEIIGGASVLGAARAYRESLGDRADVSGADYVLTALIRGSVPSGVPSGNGDVEPGRFRVTIRLMGTGAADGIPALFGDDRVSRYAREHGGREVRSRAGALIDGILKIDLPPDTWSQCAAQGVNPNEWSAILFTHGDDDHLTPNELQYALYPFTEADHAHFSIHGPAEVIEKIQARFPAWPLEMHRTSAFEPFSVHGYEVTPIRANHGEAESHNLLIKRDGWTLLYATDTGTYGARTFEFLAGRGIDLLVIECTDAQNPSGYAGHLDLISLEGLLSRLRREGALHIDARVVTTHHAAKGDATHGDLIDLLEPLGAEPGYDGMLLQV